MSSPEQTQRALAGDWVLRLQSEDLNSQELSAWLEWYSADPAHAQAFDELQCRYESLRTIPRSQRELLAKSLMEPTIISQAPSTRPYFAIAAGVAAVALGIGLWRVTLRETPQPTHTAVYQTPRATHENISLPDGTKIKLGASSSVSLNFTDEGRYLVLENGEAFFEVARDAKRPFTVQVGAVTVRALGTAFNVRRAQQRVLVAVSEGLVEVGQKQAASGKSTVRVAAGEQVNVNPTSQAISMAPADPKAVAAWREGRLEFVNEPFGSVIATVNRYSSREIVVTDPQLADASYTGTVNEERIEEWLQALPDAFPLRVNQVGGATVLVSLQK